MKYQPPYGVTDPNAPYINGNPAAGIQGSIPPAAVFEYPEREIVNTITINGITPDDGDLQQLARAIRSQAANYLIDTGALNALVVAPNPALGAYTPGLPLRVKVLNSNISDGTHATLTLDAGAGPASIIMPDGTLPPSNTLRSGGISGFIFDGAKWQVQNVAITGGGGTNTQTITKIPYCDDTGAASNAIRAIYAPPIMSISEGDFLSVKLAFPLITGAATIAVNALPAKPVTHVDGTNPITGDAAAGQILLMCFDGTRFQIVSVMGTPSTADSPVRAVFATVTQTIPNGFVPTWLTGWAIQKNTFPGGSPLGPDYFVAPTTGVYLVVLFQGNDVASGSFSSIDRFDASNTYILTCAAGGMNAYNNLAQSNSWATAGVFMNAGEKLRMATAHGNPGGPLPNSCTVFIGKMQ